MSKRIVILSTIVDEIIKDKVPDVDVDLFKSITSLSTFVETTPIRADVFYITTELLENTTNTSLSVLFDIIEHNHFFRVDRVEFLSESGSKAIPSIEYLVELKGLDNWEVHKGHLNREYVSSIITGTYKSEDLELKHKALYRVRKDVYLKERRQAANLDNHFKTDSELLSNVEREESFDITLKNVENICKQVNIVGLPRKERTVFAFLMAQYLALEGKVILIEKDFDYLTVTDMAAKSGVEYLEILIEDIYDNPQDCINKIQSTASKLIIIGTRERINRNYLYLVNFIYNNIIDSASYIIKELDFEEVPEDSKSITVVPNNIVDILKSIENISTFDKFVGINMSRISEINSSEELTLILRDLLNTNEIENVPIFNISSLKIGGEVYDLSSLVR